MNPVIAIDGYVMPSTKDQGHVIRQKGTPDTSAVIKEDMIFWTKKAKFLENSEKKTNFPKLLAKAI